MKLYTANEMAKLLKVYPKTVYKWGASGKLLRVKIGKSVRFALPEMEKDYAERKAEEQRTARCERVRAQTET